MTSSSSDAYTVRLTSVLLKITILPEDTSRLLAEFTVPTIRSTLDEILDAAENSPPQANEWGGAKLAVQLGNVSFGFQYVHGALTEVMTNERRPNICLIGRSPEDAHVTGNGRTDVLRKLTQEFGIDWDVEYIDSNFWYWGYNS